MSEIDNNAAPGLLPADSVVISIDFAKAPCGERNKPIRKPTAIRGFFVLPYAPIYPPDAD